LESKATNPNWVRINSWGKINFNQHHLNTSKSIFMLRITFRQLSLWCSWLQKSQLMKTKAPSCVWNFKPTKTNDTNTEKWKLLGKINKEKSQVYWRVTYVDPEDLENWDAICLKSKRVGNNQLTKSKTKNVSSQQ